MTTIGTILVREADLRLMIIRLTGNFNGLRKKIVAVESIFDLEILVRDEMSCKRRVCCYRKKNDLTGSL